MAFFYRKSSVDSEKMGEKFFEPIKSFPEKRGLKFRKKGFKK